MLNLDALTTVQSAIDFIEEHLDEKVAVATVAQHAGFSEFHFHRIFISIIGESVSSYQRRRRLSRAAGQLKNTALAVAKIAADAGFDSQEAFTRAFKALFGSTPALYRKGVGLFAMEKPRLTKETILHLNGGLTMQPQIRTFPGAHIVGMADGFNPDTTVHIADLWRRFLPACHAQNLDLNLSYGVCMAEHTEVAKEPGESFIYMAGVPVPTTAHTPPAMVSFDIPEGKYAVFTHKGSIKDFPKTVKYIWSTWIPENKHLYREAPDFELYDERFDPRTESGEVDIYIPVN